MSVPRDTQRKSSARLAALARRVGLRLVAIAAACVAGAGAAPTPCASAPQGLPSRPEQVLAPKRFPGWQAWNVAFPAVLRDPRSGGYRMYYSGTGTSRMNESIADDWVIGVATSSDGLTWRPPDDYEPALLARRSLEGDVLDAEDLAAVFDSVAVFGASVVLDDDGTYRMWYTGWNGETEYLGEGRDRIVHQRIGYATSSDGRTWAKAPGAAGAGAVLGLGAPGSADAVGVAHPCVLRVPGGYRMWYEAFDGRVFRILSARSSDGLAWTKEGVALEPGAAGGLDALGARRPSVVRRGQRYELWYEGLAEDQARYHVLRAASTDLAPWTKLPGEIDLWSGRMADAENVAGAVLVNADGSCRVFFSSRRTRVPPRMARPGPRVDFSIYAVTVKP